MSVEIILAVFFLTGLAIQDALERQVYVIFAVFGYACVLVAQFSQGNFLPAFFLSLFLSIPALFLYRDGSIELGDVVGFPLIWASVAGGFTFWLILAIYSASPVAFLINKHYEIADSVPAYVPITLVYLVYAALTVF